MAALVEEGDIAHRHQEVAEQEHRREQVGVARELQNTDTQRIEKEPDE